MAKSAFLEVDEFDLSIIRDFIGQSWSDFVGFCADRAEDGNIEAERLYAAIGGEE